MFNKAILILDYFFLKYEGGGGGFKLTAPLQKKLLSKTHPVLLGLTEVSVYPKRDRG